MPTRIWQWWVLVFCWLTMLLLFGVAQGFVEYPIFCFYRFPEERTFEKLPERSGVGCTWLSPDWLPSRNVRWAHVNNIALKRCRNHRSCDRYYSVKSRSDRRSKTARILPERYFGDRKIALKGFSWLENSRAHWKHGWLRLPKVYKRVRDFSKIRWRRWRILRKKWCCLSRGATDWSKNMSSNGHWRESNGYWFACNYETEHNLWSNSIVLSDKMIIQSLFSKFWKKYQFSRMLSDVIEKIKVWPFAQLNRYEMVVYEYFQ